MFFVIHYKRNACFCIQVSDLTITNLTKEDRGSYRCSADNSVRPPDEMYSKLSIEFKPSVAPVEPSYGAATSDQTGDSAMLWCQVDGMYIYIQYDILANLHVTCVFVLILGIY